MKTIERKEVMKMIRASLKEAFAGVKFSVRQQRGTSSAIYINWEDGCNEAQVEAVVKRFQDRGFNGMNDYEYSIYHSLNGEEVSLHSGYIFTSRTISGEVKEQRRKLYEARGYDLSDYDTECDFYKSLRKLSFCPTAYSKTADSLKVIGDEMQKEEEAREKREAEKLKAELAERFKKLELLDQRLKNERQKHNVKADSIIESIFVEWSESRAFTEKTSYTYAEFCELAKMSVRDGGGYDKTKIVVHIKHANGESDQWGFRFDLGDYEPDLKTALLCRFDYIIEQETKNEPSYNDPEYEKFLVKLAMFLDFDVNNYAKKPHLHLMQ